jgi:uncharacterized protein (DUF983 family)
LFRRWFSMLPACPGCGLVFRRAPGHWLGSWFLNVLLVQAVLVVGISLLVAATWPARLSWPGLTLIVAMAIGIPLAFFPFSRTLWTALDLIMRPLDFHDGVAPGVELEQAEHHRPRSRHYPPAKPPSKTTGEPPARPPAEPPDKPPGRSDGSTGTPPSNGGN